MLRLSLVSALAMVGLVVAVQRCSIASVPEAHASGLFQGDMPTYVCFANAAHADTGGLTYQSPHDLREDGARLVNLPITLLHWLLRAGLSPAQASTLLRIALGIAMFVLLAALVHRVVPGRLAAPTYLITAFGGGFAWAGSLKGFGFSRWAELDAWIQHEVGFEGHTYWWFLQLFRNLWYPLELIYHCLVFAQLLSLARRRWKTSVLLQLLGCLSNPFVGIQMSAVQGITLAMALHDRRVDRRAVIASALVALCFVFYYAVHLPNDPVIHSLQRQHRDAHTSALGLSEMAWAYGPALLGLPLAFAYALRAKWRAHWTLAPVVALALATFLLSQNSLLVDGLMPLHFTRGYLHTSLWIVLVWHGAKHAGAASGARRRVLVTFLWVSVLLSFVGTGFFLRQQVVRQPASPNLIWDAEHAELLAVLASEPQELHVIASDWVVGPHACSLVHHKSAFGTPLTTPYYAARIAELDAYAQSGARGEIIRWADAIVCSANGPLRRRLRRDPGWRVWHVGSRWALFRRDQE